MGFRKGSAAILCATAGLGLSQNFAVSADAKTPDEISLATGEENVLGAVEGYSSKAILCVAIVAPFILYYSVFSYLCLLGENSELKDKLNLLSYRFRRKIFFDFACKLYETSGKSLSHFEKYKEDIHKFLYVKDARRMIEKFLNCFKSRKIHIIKKYIYIIYTLYFCEKIDLEYLKLYEEMISDNEKSYEDRILESEKFVTEALKKLGCAYAEILKSLESEKRENRGYNKPSALNGICFQNLAFLNV